MGNEIFKRTRRFQRGFDGGQHLIRNDIYWWSLGSDWKEGVRQSRGTRRILRDKINSAIANMPLIGRSVRLIRSHTQERPPAGARVLRRSLSFLGSVIWTLSGYKRYIKVLFSSCFQKLLLPISNGLVKGGRDSGRLFTLDKIIWRLTSLFDRPDFKGRWSSCRRTGYGAAEQL